MGNTDSNPSNNSRNHQRTFQQTRSAYSTTPRPPQAPQQTNSAHSTTARSPQVQLSSLNSQNLIEDLIDLGDPGTNNNPSADMATEAVETGLKKLNLKDKNEINILLLGETGVGKSTFINSVLNYLQFEDFKKAEKEQLNVLIPSQFTIEDKNGIIQRVEVGTNDDKNEVLVSGVSATQAVKTYSFCINNGQTMVRLIDTPGMGDTRGIIIDKDNCENILNYINRLHHLHAICYLTKAQQSRSTVFFEYCVSQILSRLEKSACKNIIFVFTHTKGNNYKPGETMQLLRNLSEEIRKNPAHAEIPLDKNSFSFDNEAFRALAAIKKGVQLSSEDRHGCIESWKRSTKQCWEMISYILDLPPHLVHNTAAINEARRIIYRLAQPMADIAQLINDNIQILKSHESHLDMDTRSLEQLKKKLYIPVIDLVVKRLTQPVTVCADLQCAEVYRVGEKKEWHYKQRCHDPCYLTNVPRDIMGSPELINCASMGTNQNCKKCGHSYKVHMHVYYITEKKHTEKKDDIVSSNIDSKAAVIDNIRRIIKEVEARKNQLERELNTIVMCNAKFAHFLSNNAIAPFSDSYAGYIEYLIIKEKRLGSDADFSKMAGLERLLREHSEMKKTFKEAAEMQKRLGRTDPVTPQEIDKSMQELFKLTINGKKVKELFDSQKNALGKEYRFSEYIHKGVFTPLPPDQNKNKQNEKSSASNPTTKFQRGRPNNRGNVQRGRGAHRGQSPGGPARNRDRHSPPPPYHENRDVPNYPPPNFPPDYRGLGYSQPHYPPPPAHPAPRDPAGNPGEKPSVQVHVTYNNPADQGNPPRDPLPRDYPHPDYHRDYPPRDNYPGNYPPREAYPPRDPHGYPPRDPYAYPPRDGYPPRDPYPPREPYPPRDPYAPRDSYPPRDPYSPRDPYPPRDAYPPRDGYHPRDAYPPRDGYPHREAYPPRDGYQPRDNYGARYYGQGPSSDNNSGRPHQQAPGNYHQNNHRGQFNQRGRFNNKGNRGGINRAYRKRNNNNANTNSGDESDTSVASSKK